jgi:hypothetical protein
MAELHDGEWSVGRGGWITLFIIVWEGGYILSRAHKATYRGVFKNSRESGEAGSIERGHLRQKPASALRQLIC